MLIAFYQENFSKRQACCRFLPTCSQYAQDALVKHSINKAVFLIVKRLLRCHPWGNHGYDPVP